jgi:hypothetical protein
MARPAGKYIERDKTIASRVTAGEGYLSINKDVPISYAQFKLILITQGVPLPPRGARLGNQATPSNVSLAMGHRMEVAKAQKIMGNHEFGLWVGLSEVNLGRAFRGTYTWPLADIQRIAAKLDIHFAEFTKPLGGLHG